MAAYAGLDRAYKEYRQRVTNEFGADTDLKFATGSSDIVIEEKLANGKVQKTVVQGKRNGGASPYAALFDEKSQHWTTEPHTNPLIINMIQSNMNLLLRNRGHVFLNEVYDRLDLPRTSAGAVVGWIYTKENEEKVGDNYIDFGIFERSIDDANAFMDGEEKSIWLDFNVDGVIYDKIGKKDNR
jgi:hypothetical protein